ncbi:3-deoxy-D-manno-octulosonic acid transferase [Thalassotalea loyana]|uniref:3-deoxy-D-manno-octulosonic acid transferase n=1 Tax=Thalassotalea loyana TaxID=280483 RepID=A0ABQ6HAN5_9GAMM|nr:lipid IV(A) 3-deoxy-D-manno-octulosonic acid transferase [Thalassotalea loyana]GLX83830.1 3-deoxy-D-manno-octulosonic acid transferase [Thalassotalea loyana]
MKYAFALLCYRLLLLLLTPLLVVALVIRSINHKAYRNRLLERLGIVPKGFLKGGLIIHASSVGEVLALKPLVTELLITHPTVPITFTTFTPTGSEQVIKHFGDRVQHCYLPIDNPISSLLFLKALSPKSFIVMETELWPNIIAQAHSRGTQLQLINARLSNKSMKSYRKLTWLITPCLNRFDDILCQSHDNKENFVSLGSPSSKTSVSGNLKYDIKLTSEIIDKQKELASYIESSRPIWLVASTHPGDEDIVLSAFEQVLQSTPECLLILVPRHPERFNDIAKRCESRFNTVRRSTKNPVSQTHQIWLMDSLGELMAAFSLADVVTMGGSFSQIGGHNPLEPAFYCKPIIVGPNMSNFKEVTETMRRGEGIVQLSNDSDAYTDELAQRVMTILTVPQKQKELGENARKVVDQNQGALAVTTKKISQYLV